MWYTTYLASELLSEPELLLLLLLLPPPTLSDLPGEGPLHGIVAAVVLAAKVTDRVGQIGEGEAAPAATGCVAIEVVVAVGDVEAGRGGVSRHHQVVRRQEGLAVLPAPTVGGAVDRVHVPGEVVREHVSLFHAVLDVERKALVCACAWAWAWVSVCMCVRVMVWLCICVVSACDSGTHGTDGRPPLSDMATTTNPPPPPAPLPPWCAAQSPSR
jgi:hypothetical protein